MSVNNPCSHQTAFTSQSFEENDKSQCKTLVDFTDDDKKKGMPAKKLLKQMKKFENKILKRIKDNDIDESIESMSDI